MKYYSIADFEKGIKLLAGKINKKYKGMYAVPRGGYPVAIGLQRFLKLPLVDEIGESILVVDDLVDSGRTRIKYMDSDYAVLHIKETTPISLLPTYYVSKENDWIEYFWEKGEAPAEDSVVRIIEAIGEDPTREGLIETPMRVIKSWKELYKGYEESPEKILKVFDSEGYDQLVLLKDIELYSMCEHHMIPFIGKAHVGYIPNGKIVGISKLARLIEVFSRRLQIQERITDQVTDTLMRVLNPLGAGCIIEAQHLCMRMRGIKKQNSVMVTSSMRGVFLEDTEKGIAARSEFLRLLG